MTTCYHIYAKTSEMKIKINLEGPFSKYRQNTMELVSFTLLEYNTLIGVYQIGVYCLLSFFRSDDGPFINNYVQLRNLDKMLNFILLSNPHPCPLIKAHFCGIYQPYIY